MGRLQGRGMVNEGIFHLRVRVDEGEGLFFHRKMSFADHHAAYQVSFCNMLMSAVFLIQVFPANCFVFVLHCSPSKQTTQTCTVASSSFARVKVKRDRLINKLKMSLPNQQSGVSAGSDIAAKFDAINSNRRDISINIGILFLGV